MSNTQRPSLAKQHTRKSEKAREDALNRGLSITMDGTRYTVREGDLTSMDTMALRRETGLSFVALMRAFLDSPDIDLIAALVWLARRQAGEVNLPFIVVAGDIDYDSTIEMADMPEVDDSPEV